VPKCGTNKTITKPPSVDDPADFKTSLKIKKDANEFGRYFFFWLLPYYQEVVPSKTLALLEARRVPRALQRGAHFAAQARPGQRGRRTSRSSI
jgi:hypothetical protein